MALPTNQSMRKQQSYIALGAEDDFMSFRDDQSYRNQSARDISFRSMSSRSTSQPSLAPPGNYHAVNPGSVPSECRFSPLAARCSLLVLSTNRNV
jgi:hypothetical protein